MMERRLGYSFLISLLVFHLDFFWVGFVVPIDGIHGTFSLGDYLLCIVLQLPDPLDAVAEVCHAEREDTAATAALSLDAPAAEHEEECDDEDESDAEHYVRGQIII